MKLLKKIYYDASHKTAELVQRMKMTEHLFMIVLAIIIGLLGGFGAVGIRALIELVSELSFPGPGTILQNIMAAPWYMKILVPAIGGLLVGPIIYYLAPEAKGHGVPEVMQAILLKGGHIRPRVASIKAFASSITIGTGGSVGREGPIIQIGASIGSTVGQFFRVKSNRLRTLVGCGAGAGIAAAFNAPIAGALFAVEIILMDFSAVQFTPIVISSVIATVVSHQFEGNYPAFVVPAYHLESPYEIGFYFILGILCGLISFLFIKVLYFFEDLWDNKIRMPEIFKAFAGGAIIGIIAIAYPQVMGVGYESISTALNSDMLWHIALILIFLKILATSVTLGSGGSGGIFAPSLFMGAMAGAFFGHFIHLNFPGMTAEHGAYALVAMGGLVAGTTRAPITAIIIVFEMTKDYNIILPLMVVCTLSMILSSKLSRESIYTLKLLKRNIKIKERAEVNVLRSINVSDVYSKDFQWVYENVTFNIVVNKMLTGKIPYVTVLNMNDEIMGIISLQHIKEYLFEKEELKYILIAGDIADKRSCYVNPDDTCRFAIKKMAECGYDALPVVSSDNPRKQIGIVWRKDIDDAYHKEIQHIELTSDLAQKISIQNAAEDVTFLEGYVITEIDPPPAFIGKSIREIGIRNKYGVDVLTIKREEKAGKSIKAIPQANYIIGKHDRLVIAGEKEKINVLRSMI